MTCRERLEAYLQANWVQFRVYEHAAAYTAQAVAEREHIPHKLMAKVVVVVADGQLVMLVLPTSRRVDLAKVSALLNAREVRLASEAELAMAFPDCEIGATPPFSNGYNLPLYADRSLEDEPILFFQAGSHSVAMSIAFADYVRLAQPRLADFVAEHRRLAPVGYDDVHEMGGW